MLKRRSFLGFISPWLVGMVVLTLVPICYTIYTSFTTWSGNNGARWTGLANYRSLIHDSIFVDAVVHTVYYAVGTVLLQVVVAFALAVLLSQELRGHRFYRAMLFIPYVVGGIPLYVTWTWMYYPNFGLFDWLLGVVGIHGPAWLQDPTWAMPALIIMNGASCGGMMLVFVAALQGIPKDLFEAAELDGAGVVARARRITLPILWPVVGFNVIWGLIATIQVFAQPYAMTGGGPDFATEVLGIDIYQNAFTYFRFGYASAIAVVAFVGTLGLSIVVFRLTRSREQVPVRRSPLRLIASRVVVRPLAIRRGGRARVETAGGPVEMEGKTTHGQN
jgi:multiple sugar transport system permease protein